MKTWVVVGKTRVVGKKTESCVDLTWVVEKKTWVVGSETGVVGFAAPFIARYYKSEEASSHRLRNVDFSDSAESMGWNARKFGRKHPLMAPDFREADNPASSHQPRYGHRRYSRVIFSRSRECSRTARCGPRSVSNARRFAFNDPCFASNDPC